MLLYIRFQSLQLDELLAIVICICQVFYHQSFALYTVLVLQQSISEVREDIRL